MNELFGNPKKTEKIDFKIWVYFVIFVVIFLVGAYVLYVWWLGPWINAVDNQQNMEVIVPGVDETDSDGDGLSLKEESRLGTSDNMTDSDGDGLADDEEVKLGTNPLKKDTDGDGYSDGVEVDTKHDPLK